MAHLLRDCGAKSVSPSLCRPCRVVGGRARYFSSSATMMAGPESPQYIDIPEPLQPKYVEKKPVKGTLPVPREIFPRRRADKPTKSYLDDATQEPRSNKPNVPPGHPHRESWEWKRQMASTRRKNLRAGLQELYERKRKTEADLNRRSRTKTRYARAVQQQPPRDDERLTTPSTTRMMQDTQLVYGPDPDAEKHLQERKDRVAAKENARQQKRLDAIHTLLMNARHFITTEKQLALELDKVFPVGDQENEAWANNREAGTNIWNLGRPLTVEAMVARMQNEDTKHQAVQQRTHKLAEVLTGGTMDDPANSNYSMSDYDVDEDTSPEHTKAGDATAGSSTVDFSDESALAKDATPKDTSVGDKDDGTKSK